MKAPALSVPTKRTSGWVAETDPKYARAWLESLPLANGGEAAREIYQALYTLNRLELPAAQRLELMDLYEGPIQTVAAALQTHLARATQPLSPKKRQLAEFIRRLHMEAAYGYKCCLQDMVRARFRWGRGDLLARIAERALHSLREVLLGSYQVYMPYPPGIWRETHEIYRFAEARGIHIDPIAVRRDGASKTATLAERYLQIAFLGISQPYQLPQNACPYLSAFLDQWAGQARISPDLAVANAAGHFLVDLDSDAPPFPVPRNKAPSTAASVRMINAIGLVGTAQGFVGRLQRGEPVAALALGVDCLEETCLDLLQRLVSLWGLSPQRRFKRIRRNSNVSVCFGLSALHFFANGQSLPEPLAPQPRGPSSDEVGASNEAFIELDQPADADTTPASPSGRVASAPSSFRVDRWLVRDTGPQGMLLTRYGDLVISVRVGDLLGLQDTGGVRWSAAVVRWLKSPEGESLEVGIELLAADVTPVLVHRAAAADDTPYAPALLLPPATTPRRPASLLVARGAFGERGNLYLLQGARPPRLIRPLKLLERTTSYERVIFADISGTSA